MTASNERPRYRLGRPGQSIKQIEHEAADRYEAMIRRKTMRQPHDLVREFHQATGLTSQHTLTIPGDAEIDLRINLIREECAEAIEALENLKSADETNRHERLAHVGKELADVIYVAAGAEVTLGLPGPEVFAEVHRSNMSKLPICRACQGTGQWHRAYSDTYEPCSTCDSTGRRPAIRREDGKILKPQTYSPADIESVLLGQTEND